MKVKICGITNLNDAIEASSLGANALGFIFAKSPRQITPQAAKEIIKQLPPFISSVGVFVNEDINKVKKIASDCKLDVIQLHGDETPEYCTQLTQTVIKAIRINNIEDLKLIDKYQPCTKGILLDTYVKNIQGGTGLSFDWDLANKAQEHNHPIIVAGGITPQNVKQAIITASPYGIDVSSGVESEPGKKDYQKLIQLFENLK